MFQFYSCTISLFHIYSMLVTFSILTPPSLRPPHPRPNISTCSTSFKPPIFMLPHPLSASFSFVGGEGRRTINCGGAATQSVERRETKEVENPMGKESEKGKNEKHAREGINGTNIGTYAKAMESIQFNMATTKSIIIGWYWVYKSSPNVRLLFGFTILELSARQNAIFHPMLCNGTAASGSCLKRIVPANIENMSRKVDRHCKFDLCNTCKKWSWTKKKQPQLSLKALLKRNG